MGFFHILPAVIALLQREGRVSYSALQYEFGFDQAFLNVLKRELIFKRLAIDEDGEGLVWTGAGQVPAYPAVALPGHSTMLNTAPFMASAPDSDTRHDTAGIITFPPLGKDQRPGAVGQLRGRQRRLAR